MKAVILKKCSRSCESCGKDLFHPAYTQFDDGIITCIFCHSEYIHLDNKNVKKVLPPEAIDQIKDWFGLNDEDKLTFNDFDFDDPDSGGVAT